MTNEPSTVEPVEADAGGGGRAIIDVHSHAVLPVWVEMAAGTQMKKMSARVNQPWSLESHLRVMDEHGIDVCILSLPRAGLFLEPKAARELARRMNEEFASIIARHPKRFGAFAAMPLGDTDAMIEETQYALDVLKLNGVSSTTNIEGAYIGDTRFDAWLDELNRRGTALFVHPTVPPAIDAVNIGQNIAVFEYMFEVTRMLAKMVFSGSKQRCPDIKFIATHGGGTMPYIAHRVGILHEQYGSAGGEPTLSYEDTISVLSTFYYDLTAATSHAQLDALRRLVPVSQILMGFDYPYMPDKTIEPAMDLFNKYDGFSSGEKQSILRDNSLTLFPELA